MSAHATKSEGRPGVAIGPGWLVLVVGPSGAGKDTLIGRAQVLLAGDETIVFPRRVVTREASVHEDNLRVTPAEFDQAVAAGSFALSWRAHGHGYGLPHAIDGDIRAGRTVVANVSRTIVSETRERYANTAVVLVTAPSEVLAQRLAARQRSSDVSIDERLARASKNDDALAPDRVILNIGSPEDGGREIAGMIMRLKRNARCATSAEGGG